MSISKMRIAVNNVCNMRCVYCRPGFEAPVDDPGAMMRIDEMEDLVRIAVKFGVSQISLTGGEPLVRKDIVELVRRLKAIDGIRKVSLGTNGILLKELGVPLKEAGVDSLNLSLDTVDHDTFKGLTQTKTYQDVMDGIQEARRLDIPIRLNTVVLKGYNDDDYESVINFAVENRLNVKFSDFLYLGNDMFINDEHENFYTPLNRIREYLEQDPRFERRDVSKSKLGTPMDAYISDEIEVKLRDSTLGAFYVSTCKGCTLYPCQSGIFVYQISFDGKIKMCILRSDNYLDILTPMREGASDSELSEIFEKVYRLYNFEAFTNREWAKLYEKGSLPTNSDRAKLNILMEEPSTKKSVNATAAR